MNAFGADTPAHIPPASDYGDYDMFEDGIGIVRSYVDEFEEVCENGLAARAAEALAARNLTARYIIGEAMQPFLDAMSRTAPWPWPPRPPHGEKRLLRRQRQRHRPPHRLRHRPRHQGRQRGRRRDPPALPSP